MEESITTRGNRRGIACLLCYVQVFSLRFGGFAIRNLFHTEKMSAIRQSKLFNGRQQL
jgi:hypothetical protein